MSQAPLSILHVLAPTDVGGLETVVQLLAAGHTHCGHSVEIAAVVTSPKNLFVEQARDAGIKVHVIASPARSFLPERHGVRDLIKRKRVDVVHSHGYRSDILDIAVARHMGVPSITTLHGFAANDRKARAYEWLQLRSIRRASAVVAVSTNVVDKVLASGVYADRVYLVRNATTPIRCLLSKTDARARLHLDNGLQIGWIGRLSSEKGPDLIIDAMQYLTDLPVKLSIVGDGPDLNPLKAKARQLGVAESIHFHGRITNAASLLRAFDLMTLSSRTEGTPMVILEAMSAGTPIVSARIGGVPDMLSDADALLVPPADSRLLAAGIRAALGDLAEARLRASHAQVRVATEFGADAWLAKYESLYQTIRGIEPGRSL